MDWTTYLRNNIFDHVFRNSAYTSPTTVYLGLYTTATNEAGAGTEVTGGSYARVAITVPAPTNGVASNVGAISFPTPTAAWGTVTHVAILDASSGGNMLAQKILPSPRAVGIGDTVEMDPGNLTLSVS